MTPENIPKQDLRKRRKIFLTLKNNRNNRIRFPKFRFRDIAGRFHNHTKHGSEWVDSKFQQTKSRRHGRWSSAGRTAPGGKAWEDFREEGRGEGNGWISDGLFTEGWCKLISKLPGLPAVPQAPTFEFGKCGSEKNKTSTKNNYV